MKIKDYFKKQRKLQNELNELKLENFKLKNNCEVEVGDIITNDGYNYNLVTDISYYIDNDEIKSVYIGIELYLVDEENIFVTKDKDFIINIIPHEISENLKNSDVEIIKNYKLIYEKK